MVHTFCRYPYRNECSQHTFFTYYFCDAVGKTWSALTSCTLLSISSLKSSSHSPPPPPTHTHTHTHRQSLYDNEQQVQDHFTMFWEQVARRFKNNPYVLGGPLPPPPPSLPSSLPSPLLPSPPPFPLLPPPSSLSLPLLLIHHFVHAGYELLNEPWAGDIYTHLDQLEPRMYATIRHIVSCLFPIFPHLKKSTFLFLNTVA